MGKSPTNGLTPWLSRGQFYNGEMYIFFTDGHRLHPFSRFELKKMIGLRVTVPGSTNLFFESYKNMFAF